MTVKELMAQVDPERVNDAFLLLDYTYSAENFENTLLEKHKSIPKLREVIKENIRLFAECTPNDDAELYTIFIILTPGDDYQDQHRKETVFGEDTDRNTVGNRLYVTEKFLKSEEELLQDIEKFRNAPDPIYTEIFNDIFGDG